MSLQSLIKIAESLSLEMDDLPVCGTQLNPDCEDGSCGECGRCINKEYIVEDDVEAQTPRGSRDSDGASISPNFGFDSPGAAGSITDNLSFDLSPDTPDTPDTPVIPNTTDAPDTPDASDRREASTLGASTISHEEPINDASPIYDFINDSERAVVPPKTWMDYIPLPTLPSLPIPFSPTPPVEVKPAEGVDPDTIPVASAVATELVKPSFTRIKPISQTPQTPNKQASKDVSERTVRATNTKMIHSNEAMNLSLSKVSKSQPIELGLKRHGSVALFAKPSVSRDSSEDHELDESRTSHERDKNRVSIHDSGKDGEQSVFEVSHIF